MLAFYEDHDSNDREPMPSEAHAGNCTRTIQGPFVRAPVANMTPRKSIWEVPEVEEAPAFDMRRNPKAFDATANKPAIADESDSNSQDSSFLPDQPTRHSSGSRDSEDPNNQVNGNQNNTAKRMTEHDAEEDEVPDGE